MILLMIIYWNYYLFKKSGKNMWIIMQSRQLSNKQVKNEIINKKVLRNLILCLLNTVEVTKFNLQIVTKNFVI